MAIATNGASATTDLRSADWEEFRRQRPLWSVDPDLGDGVESAIIEVPLDYAEPDCERITIAISRRRATDAAHRRGVLLSVHGGPGGDNGHGRRMPAEFARRTPLNEIYDLVGFDPRGTGSSTRLDGEDTPTQAPFDSRPPDTAFETIAADMKAREEGCRRAGGTLRPYVSTRNTARDLDVIRSVLGEEQISFVGYAYGTLVGAVYGTMFPAHLDRSVLDSSVHPDWDWRQQFMSQAVAVRENVDAWAEWVGERDGRYGLGTGAEGVLASVEDVATQLAEQSEQAAMRTSFDGIIGRQAPLRPEWDGLATLIGELRTAAAERDTTKAKDLLAGQSTWRPASAAGDTREAVLEAVTCETDWPADLDGYFEDMRRFRDDYPYGFGLLRAQPWVGTFRTFTPAEPATDVRREGYPPGVVVQADADPVDYHEGGRAMAARLAFLFAATDVDAINEAFGFSGAIFATALTPFFFKVVIIISTIGQFFCGMSCVTSMSRMTYAFSRDRAVPGWKLWSKVDRNGTPVNAILAACVAGGVLTLPALYKSPAGIPVAFYAVVSVAVIGLYLAFLIPIVLRLRMGDRFVPGPWTLGRKYKILGWIATIEIIVISIYFILPVTPTGVPGAEDFTWFSVNYAPLAVGGLVLLVALWWYVSARKWFTGPRRNVEEPVPVEGAER